jgi:hypothetical protein
LPAAFFTAGPRRGCIRSPPGSCFHETINPDYEVVRTCRIASLIPRITTGDPSASIIMIAEKAADMILGRV